MPHKGLACRYERNSAIMDFNLQFLEAHVIDGDGLIDGDGIDNSCLRACVLHFLCLSRKWSTGYLTRLLRVSQFPWMVSL
jgi:hypothetical protein